MEDEKINKGGRPRKYDGEKSIRIGALIRPRYKQAIDIIARDRGSTLGEVVELAISKLARESKLQHEHLDKEAPYIIDYVRHPYEPLERIYFSFIPLSKIIYDLTDKTGKTPYQKIMGRLKETPEPLLSALNIHIGDVIHTLEDELDGLKGFSEPYLLEAIEEDWKEGIPVETTAENIRAVFYFYTEQLEYFIEFFEENPPLPPKDADIKTINEYIANIKSPFIDEDPSSEATLEDLHSFHATNFS